MTDDPFQPPQGSRPASPQSAASVRSQAVAKLRRAASLPRKPIPRRPSNNNAPNEGGDLSAEGSGEGSGQYQDAAEPAYPTLAAPAHGQTYGQEQYQYGQQQQQQQQQGYEYSYADQEEMLSPSPRPDQYAYPYIPRSASSSSLHPNAIPTPPHLMPYSQASTPYDSSSSASPSPHPDWSMGIPNPYMPQLSPVPLIGHSPYMNPVGRNTPSPLPSLGELRNLSRSNSTAARARAMDKLTGGRETPNTAALAPSAVVATQDDTPTRPGLQRADSLGSRTHAPVANLHAAHPPSAFMEPRPRLQRSFTVSSSNMGVERRSAVGRRMVARLAERAADQQAEVEEQEAEVRRLWEERTGRADGQSEGVQGDDEYDQSYEEGGQTEQEQPIVVVRHSAESVRPRTADRDHGSLMPPLDDRPGSRNTQMSDTDAFEYAQHLSRSQSTRTARNMPLTPEQPVEPVQNAMTVEPVETLQVTDTPQRAAVPEDDQPRSSEYAGGDELNSMTFVMSSSSTPDAGMRQVSNGYPVSIADQSAEWTTPKKDTPSLSLPRTASNSVRTPSNHSQPDHDLTPPGISARTSVMSWEEVPGDSERAIPTDETYHRKIGSIGAKMGSAVRAMRKRSQSRSSTGSGPTSPGVGARPLQEALSIAVAGFSRRGSEASLSPTSTGKSFARRPPSDQVRHHPSMSSLAPSQHTSTETSTANSILLQHQLANDPQSIHEMPRARMDDPRVYNSKLSPFPGVDRPPDAPRLIHQHSDSVVPTGPKSIEIHALPLVTPPEEHTFKLSSPSPKRSSTDSKRGWFAKTLASATSPRSPRSSNRSSAVPSRKSSMADVREAASTSASQALAAAVDAPRPTDRHPTFALPDQDIFGAALQLPASTGNAKTARSRPISPSVSTVAELNEDGHRLTQFTAFRSANQTPVMEEEMRPELGRDDELLQRMDDVLALGSDDPDRPDVLDDPPRKLLLAMQVLQVVDQDMAKDRYLLLFNDLLAICKPVIPATHAGPITLDMPFIVKCIVPLDRLQVAGLDGAQRDQDMLDFAYRFNQNPFAVLQEGDTEQIANRLVSTAQLDAGQLGNLLSHPDNQPLLAAYVASLRLGACSLVDALRVLLLSAALPEDQAAGDSLLDGFARGWHKAAAPAYNVDMAMELVHALIHLSDELHGNRFGFALRNPSACADSFISAFRSRIPDVSVDEATLRVLYRSVETAPLMPPIPNEHSSARALEVQGMPVRLSRNVWSDDITVRIPAPDSDFCITLQGDGLEFEPSFLDFRQTGEQTFCMRGTSLGRKAVLMVRQGLNAPLYNNLPAAYTFSIERAYMDHTFHLAFGTPNGAKRRYCISLPDAHARSKWALLLPRQINRCRTLAATTSIEAESGSQEAKRKIAADALALSVLRDALVQSAPAVSGGRRGSISTTYALGAGKDESETLGPLGAVNNGTTARTSGNATWTGGEVGAKTTGKEVVLVCRQNSLLPDMLDLLEQPKASAGGQGLEPAVYSDKEHGEAFSRDHQGVEAVEERYKREMVEAEEREREYGVESRAQSRAAGRF